MTDVSRGRSTPRIAAVVPPRALPGGRLRVEGGPFPLADGVPGVTIGGVPARVAMATPDRLWIDVPGGIEGGRQPLRIEEAPGATVYLEIGRLVASGVHQVDNPAVDRDGRVYLTFSGSRGQQAPVSVFRVGSDGVREPFVTGLTNATSLAFDPQGRLHVTSRFDGTLHRVDANGGTELVAGELGIACGITFTPDGVCYVGDRSGTVFRIEPDGEPEPFATLPPSIAAFHLAADRDGSIVVSVPTLGSVDVIWRIREGRAPEVLSRAFGRPQGLAFDSAGVLYVAEALAGESGVYRLLPDGRRELVVAGSGVVGLAFGPGGEMIVASGDAAWRFDVPASGDGARV